MLHQPGDPPAAWPIGHAIWLRPAEPAATRLAAIIDAFSDELGTPRFDPHVTVLGQLPGSPHALGRLMDTLGAALRGVNLVLGAPNSSDQFFRCVFFELEPHPQLLHARDLGLGLSGSAEESGYRPHLSLIYAYLDQGQRHAASDRVAVHGGLSFPAASLDLVSLGGPPHTWRTVSSVGL